MGLINKKGRILALVMSIVVTAIIIGTEYKFASLLFKYTQPNITLLFFGALAFGIGYYFFLIGMMRHQFSYLTFGNGILKHRTNHNRISIELKPGAPVYSLWSAFRSPINLQLLVTDHNNKIRFISAQRSAFTLNRLESSGLVVKHANPFLMLMILFGVAALSYLTFRFIEHAPDRQLFILILPVIVISYFLKNRWYQNQITNLKNSCSTKNRNLLTRKITYQNCIVLFSLFFIIEITTAPMSTESDDFESLRISVLKNPTAQNLENLALLAEKNKNYIQLKESAWLYTVVPKVELRNPKRALDLAKQSYNSQKTFLTADTLACALMADQQKDKAISVAKQMGAIERVKFFKNNQICEDTELFNGLRAIVALGK